MTSQPAPEAIEAFPAMALRASDIGKRIEYHWEGGDYTGALLGLRHEWRASGETITATKVEVLTEYGGALGPQWHDLAPDETVKVAR